MTVANLGWRSTSQIRFNIELHSTLSSVLPANFCNNSWSWKQLRPFKIHTLNRSSVSRRAVIFSPFSLWSFARPLFWSRPSAISFLHSQSVLTWQHVCYCCSFTVGLYSPCVVVSLAVVDLEILPFRRTNLPTQCHTYIQQHDSITSNTPLEWDASVRLRWRRTFIFVRFQRMLC